MRDLFKFLTCAAVVAAAPAFAQDTATETEATEAANDIPEVGQRYEKTTHGDWIIECVRAPIGQTDPCQMTQLLKDPQGNPVSEFIVTPLANAEDIVAVARILTPLETFLPPGIEVKIDGKEAGRLPFLVCSSQHCASEFPMKPAEAAAFKRGGEATLTIVPAVAPDQKVELKASLKGFTAAFDSLQPKK